MKWQRIWRTFLRGLSVVLFNAVSLKEKEVNLLNLANFSSSWTPPTALLLLLNNIHIHVHSMYYIHYRNIICVCNTRRSYIVYVTSPRITFTYTQGSLADFFRSWVDPESFSTKAYVKILATKITYFNVSRQKCCILNVSWERGKKKRKRKEKEENFGKILSLI